MAKIIKPNPASRSARAAGTRPPKAAQKTNARADFVDPSKLDEGQVIEISDLYGKFGRYSAERRWYLFRKTGHVINAWQAIIELLKSNPTSPLPAGPRDFLIQVGTDMVKANKKPHQLNAQKRFNIAETVNMCFRADAEMKKTRGTAPRSVEQVYKFAAEYHRTPFREVEKIAREFGISKRRK